MFGGICPYMHILREGQMSGGGGVGGAYVLHPLFTDNQLTDVTTNRQDKSPTVTVLGIMFVISQNHFDFFF